MDDVVREVSALVEWVRGRPDVAIIGTTRDGDVVGGFTDVGLFERVRGTGAGRARAAVRRQRAAPGEGLRQLLQGQLRRCVCLVGVNCTGHMELGNEKALVSCSGLRNVFKDVDETAIPG